MAVPSGSETARPFLPAKDFATSKAFYEALGFTKLLDAPEVAIFSMGSSSFLLQRYYQQAWAENGRRRKAVNLRVAEAPDAVVALPIDHFDGLDSFEDLPPSGRCVRDLRA